MKNDIDEKILALQKQEEKLAKVTEEVALTLKEKKDIEIDLKTLAVTFKFLNEQDILKLLEIFGFRGRAYRLANDNSVYVNVDNEQGFSEEVQLFRASWQGIEEDTLIHAPEKDNTDALIRFKILLDSLKRYLNPEEKSKE